MQIDVFDIRGIENYIAQLERLESTLEERMDELCRRLVEEVGRPIVESYYSAARWEGNEDYSIETLPTKNGYSLTAKGEQVFFIEFGTGNYAGAIPNDFDLGEIEVAPGSWSQSHQQQYSTKGYWIYYGTKFTGTVPMPGMQYAKEAIINHIEAIAAEVFK